MSEGQDTNDLVSVVIPAYNAEKFVVEALESVRKQTYRPVEIVVVNDGSTDATFDIVKRYAMDDTDKALAIRLIDVGENKGVANALNVGFSHATGDFICWLSADDVYVDRTKLERQLEAMKSQGGMWSYYSGMLSGPSVSAAKRVRPVFPFMLGFFRRRFERDASARLMMQFLRNPINGSSIMISTECIETYGQFDPSRRNMNSDGDLWMRYSALGAKLVVLEGAPVFYREHGAQGSKKTEAMMFDTELTQMRMFKALEQAHKLTPLLKHSYWLLAIMMRPDVYRFRPMSVESLFGHVAGNRSEFSGLKRFHASRVLRKLRRTNVLVAIDKERVLAEARDYLRTETYASFRRELGS